MTYSTRPDEAGLILEVAAQRRDLWKPKRKPVGGAAVLADILRGFEVWGEHSAMVPYDRELWDAIREARGQFDSLRTGFHRNPESLVFTIGQWSDEIGGVVEYTITMIPGSLAF